MHNNGEHKTTPIVLSDGSSWATDWAVLRDPTFTATSRTFSQALSDAYQEIRASGDEHVSFRQGGTALDAGDPYSLSNDTNSAAGCHPTDLGHYRFANVWGKLLAPILENVSAPLPYQSKLVQHQQDVITTACAEGPPTPEHPLRCPPPPPVAWHDAAMLGLTGVASFPLPDGKRSSPYQRFPDAMRGQVSEEVWTMSLQSPGEFLLFSSDSKHLYLNITLQLPYRQYEALMPDTGHSGSDLYTLDETSGQYLWIGSNFAGFFGPSSTQCDSDLLGPGAVPKMGFRRIDGLPDSFFAKPRHYMLCVFSTILLLELLLRLLLLPTATADCPCCCRYMPLYNGPVTAHIGVDAGSIIAPDSPMIAALTAKKPVVWFGTSIAQGGAAARPGAQYLK